MSSHDRLPHFHRYKHFSELKTYFLKSLGKKKSHLHSRGRLCHLFYGTPFFNIGGFEI